MASPFQVATLGSVKGIDYSPQNRILILGDQSVVMAVQTSATVCTLEQCLNPNSTAPTFTALSQTFTIASTTDMVVSMWRAPGATAGTDDVWVVYGSDATSGTIVGVAHAIYTYATQGWNWDNTGTTAVTPATANSQTVSIVWNGTYLIVAYRDGGWNVSCSYTTTRNGSSGWVAAFTLDSGTGSHFNPILLHDALMAGGSGATILIYPKDTAAGHSDQLTCRVLLDSAASPASANWQAAVQDATTAQNTGAAQLAAAVDPATGTVHVVSGTSIATAGVYYNKLTVNASGTATWTARVAVDTTAGGLYTVSCCVDAQGRLYVFYDAGTIGTSGTVSYRTADAPYSTFSGANSTVAGTAGDALPQVPKHDVAVAGYIPFLFQRGTASFTAQFDNTIAAQQAIQAASPARVVIPRGNPFSLRAELPFMSAQRLAYPAPPLAAGLALAGTSASISAASATIYQPGLVVTTETQSGITGGPPGNNSTQTTVTWQDLSGNGWAVGMIPAYGGALIAPWYELDSGVRSISETSLSTSNPDGFIHLLANNAGVFTGTEDPTFTLTEIGPTGQAFRRYYDSGTLSPSTGPALNYRVRTAVYPGDPGHYYHRIDITNPSASAVTLAGTDGLEIAMLGGLTQASQGGSSAWIPGNGLYATVGGSETAWPGPEPTTTVADPDYVYVTATGGSGLKLAAVCVRAKASNGGQSIAALTGASNAQVTYLTNANRLKVKVRVDMSSFPGSTTMTLYYVESRPRNIAAGQASSIAADYLNPDATSILAVGTAGSPFFSLDEGAYVIAASGNVVKLTHTFPTNVTKRWTLNYKITGYTAQAAPQVFVAGNQLDNLSALTYVDTGNQIAYVVLMPALVASGAVAPDLNNGQVVIQQPTGVLSGTSSSLSSGTGTLGIAEAIAGTSPARSTGNATLAIAEAVTGTSTGPSAATATISIAEALGGAAASAAGATATLTEQAALSGSATTIGGGTASLTVPGTVVLAGTSSSATGAGATLSMAEALTGSATSVSAASATLQLLSGLQIAGTSTGLSAATGTLGLAAALSSTSPAVSRATATVVLAAALLGSADSRSFANAILSFLGHVLQTYVDSRGVANAVDALQSSRSVDTVRAATQVDTEVQGR